MYKTRRHHEYLGNGLGDYLMEKEALLVETIAGASTGIAGNKSGARLAKSYLKEQGYSKDQIDLADAKTRGLGKSGLSGAGHAILGSAGGALLTGRAGGVLLGLGLGAGAGYLSNKARKRRQMIEKARYYRGRQAEKVKG